ncbi:hypothetical protein J2W98_003602 [Paenibacillus peoriae]|uniref:Uncharacterized protein n=1 Tax=Paenibacillus peoriae TaxID=59893 RepID=A0ABU1QIS3_9BACL|nr:hypothetical protein [Paenibacillus peoriae]
MKSNVRCDKLPLSRHQLANPYFDSHMLDRLKKNESTDLCNNYTIKYVGNEFSRIEPIDASKKFSNSTALKSLKKGQQKYRKTLDKLSET